MFLLRGALGIFADTTGPEANRAMPERKTTTDLETVNPAEVGFDPEALGHVADFCMANESRMNRDIGEALASGHFGEPWPIGKTIGPVKDRDEPSGIILRDGRVVTSWGDVHRVDMTFSISKSYLALCAGIAVDDGLIPEIEAPVRELVTDGGFDSAQNRDITWRQLLQLTSEWEGTLWDKPDWVDHNRDVMAQTADNSEKGQKRELQPPGTFWEYNDVRVNRASLALMRVFNRPLPDILRERIMDPIGASDTWEWHGYDNSWVEIDGRKMQSVSGGAHWGGGLWISTSDHARVGQLVLNKGSWNGRRVLSEKWIESIKTPCALNPSYGMLWWLNTSGYETYPGAGSSSFFAIGVGTNLVWIDPENAMVVVARWIDKEAVEEFVGRVKNALIW